MASILEIVIRARDEASGVLGKISGETATAGGRLGAAGAAFSRFGTAASQAIIPLAAAGVAVTNFTSAAANANEAANKAAVVFGQSTPEIEEFARASATAFGLSRRAALEYTGTLGTILQASGLSQDATAGMSVELTKLAADLASFNNIPVDEALEKIRSGLVGETEPLRTVGVLLNAAAVEAKAMELGLADASGQLSEGAKVQARYALIMEQTAKQQGDFTRTSGSLANQQRIVSAQFENLRAEVGTKLVPVILKLLSAFTALPPDIQVAIVLIAGFGFVIAPAVIAIFSMIAALASAAVALVSFAAGLVIATGGLILIIPALVAIGVAAYVFRDQIMDVFNSIVGFLRRHQTEIVAIIAVLFPFIVPLLAAYKFRDEIAGIFGAVKGIVLDLYSFVAGTMAAVGDAIAGPVNIAKRAVVFLVQHIEDLIEIIGKIPSVSDILPNVPNVPGIPGFQSGGWVPGPIGASRLILAHGGEQVLTPGQQRSMAPTAGGLTVRDLRAALAGMTWQVDFEAGIVRLVDRRLGNRASLRGRAG